METLFIPVSKEKSAWPVFNPQSPHSIIVYNWITTFKNSKKDTVKSNFLFEFCTNFQFSFCWIVVWKFYSEHIFWTVKQKYENFHFFFFFDQVLIMARARIFCEYFCSICSISLWLEKSLNRDFNLTQHFSHNCSFRFTWEFWTAIFSQEFKSNVFFVFQTVFIM